MSYENFQPIVEVTRGNIVECVHYGAFAVVGVGGGLVARHGDADTVTFLRSSAKPLQALPFIELGGVEAFGLTEKETAILCASHDGTDDHLATIRSIQAKVGISESQLLCGVHPIGGATGKAMILRGEEPTPNRHNCSGKHTGMLAHAILRQLPTEEYIRPDHPLQQIILKTFSEMTDVPVEQIELGTDGCSAPVHAIPLRNAALGYARICDPTGLPAERAAACRKITRAMTAHPDMIAGPGDFDTVLMEVGQGKIICKGGAEGFQAVGLLPGACGKGSPAMGIAIKISDGDPGGRARSLVAVEILQKLGALSSAQGEALAKFATRPIYNWRKLAVGEIRPCFNMSGDGCS
jgi:L-asparaginase II